MMLGSLGTGQWEMVEWASQMGNSIRIHLKCSDDGKDI